MTVEIEEVWRVSNNLAGPDDEHRLVTLALAFYGVQGPPGYPDIVHYINRRFRFRMIPTLTRVFEEDTGLWGYFEDEIRLWRQPPKDSRKPCLTKVQLAIMAMIVFGVVPGVQIGPDRWAEDVHEWAAHHGMERELKQAYFMSLDPGLDNRTREIKWDAWREVSSRLRDCCRAFKNADVDCVD